MRKAKRIGSGSQDACEQAGCQPHQQMAATYVFADFAQDNRSMKILVVGGAGYIGSHTVRRLNQRGHQVLVFDNLCTGHRQAVPTGQLIVGELSQVDDLSRVLRENEIEAVLHFAAFALVGESVSDPASYYQNNVAGTLNLLDAMRSSDVSQIVFSSTTATYGNPQQLPITEQEPHNPINPYGQTKLDDEYLFEKYSKIGTKIIGLRYFNIFGKGQTLEYAGVITKFLDRINQKEPPIIFGNGKQLRDFISVEDIVMANLLAMESKISNLLVNVGTGNAITISELAKMMLNISGLGMQPIFETPLDGDIEKSRADITLLTKSFNWKPKKDLQEWLTEIL